MGKLILLLAALPVLDLYILLRLRHVIGGWPVLLAVVVSASLGVIIARVAGLRELGEWRRDVTEGRVPSHGVMNGLLLLLASAWLIMPGLITDLLGLILLITPLRVRVGNALVARVRDAIERGAVHFSVQQAPGATPAAWSSTQPQVIDVEGEVVQSSVTTPEERGPRGRLPS
jgi:UPF0716 protein FxsA